VTFVNVRFVAAVGATGVNAYRAPFTSATALPLFALPYAADAVAAVTLANVVDELPMPTE
jgi:hypothetical protein